MMARGKRRRSNIHFQMMKLGWLREYVIKNQYRVGLGKKWWDYLKHSFIKWTKNILKHQNRTVERDPNGKCAFGYLLNKTDIH